MQLLRRAGFFISICTLVLVAGCRKNIEIQDHPEAQEHMGLTDSSNIGDHIVIGDYTNMLVDSLDVQLYSDPWSGQVYHTLHIQNNSDGDLYFYLFTQMTQALGLSARSYVKCLNSDIRLRSFQVNDTLFYHRDTVNSSIHTSYRCARLDPTDTVISVTPDQTKIFQLDSLNLLMSNDTFYSDSIPLYITSNSSPQSYNPPYTYSSSYYRNCYLLPLALDRYIGFKRIRPNGTVQLGWVKLQHISSSRLIIKEVAKQE